ncbi:MAG: LysR family transcriptional regulator [Acidobacteriaceae bacterium]
MENFRIKVFRVVAQHLNFTRAAEELLLTQPAVTQQIKALEEEYGVPLFDRVGGRVTLTDAGAALLPHAERLATLAREAFEAVTSASGSVTGVLALGASQTIAQYVLPQMVATFLRSHPGAKVTAISGNTDRILGAVVEHRIQLALIEGPGLRKDIHTEPFMKDQMVLVVPPGHEWAGEEIDVSEVAGAPLLMREVGSGSRRVVENALVKAGVKKKSLNTIMELDSTEGLLSAVEAGLGCTFVSRWAIRNQLALGTLRVVHVKGLKLAREFSLVYASGPEPRGNVGAFRQFVLGYSSQVKSW